MLTPRYKEGKYLFHAFVHDKKKGRAAVNALNKFISICAIYGRPVAGAPRSTCGTMQFFRNCPAALTKAQFHVAAQATRFDDSTPIAPWSLSRSRSTRSVLSLTARSGNRSIRD